MADQVVRVFSAAAANGTVTLQSGGKRACIAIWGSGATGTVTVSVVQGGTAVVVATYANPSATGKIFCGETEGAITVAISGYSAGTISVNAAINTR